MNKEMAKHNTQILAIMADLENGMYVGSEAISSKGSIGLVYINGRIQLLATSDADWHPLQGYDIKKYMYEIIAYTATYLDSRNVEIPKEIELESDFSVAFADGYMNYISEHIDEIYELKKSEKCSFSKAVWAQLYTSRRRAETKEINERKNKNEKEYYQ